MPRFNIFFSYKLNSNLTQKNTQLFFIIFIKKPASIGAEIGCKLMMIPLSHMTATHFELKIELRFIYVNLPERYVLLM